METNEELKPWDRLPEENNLWFDRFTNYRLMGATRSLLGAVNAEKVLKGAKKTISVPEAWSIAHDRYNWKERAEAWDVEQRQIREVEFQKFWQEHRDRMKRLSGSLCERADTMLKHPLVKQEVKKTYIAKEAGEEIPVVTVINPVKWSASTVTNYLQTADELAKSAVGSVDLAIEFLERCGYTVKAKESDSK